MKTNTNRIQKNRSAARTSPQVQTHRNLQPPSDNGSLASTQNPGAKDGIADLPCDGAILSFFVQDEDGILSSVPISAGRLAGLKRLAADSGCSLGSFVHQGLARALAELEGRHDVRRKAEEMHQAVAQEQVLLELIENHLDWREHHRGIDFTGETADKFNFGLAMLIQNTRERLENADKEMQDAAYQKTGLAS
jgi:hypothetical protein